MREQRSGWIARRSVWQRPGSEIPAEEIQCLALRLADARDWAVRGRPALGYAMLMQGLMHAERSLLAGEPWARELISSWRSAIEQFCSDYDPQREE